MLPYITRCCMLVGLLPLAGCLNLGGKTTHVHETPETKSRLSALETRVGALEQAFSTTGIPTSGIPAPSSYEIAD